MIDQRTDSTTDYMPYNNGAGDKFYDRISALQWWSKGQTPLQIICLTVMVEQRTHSTTEYMPYIGRADYLPYCNHGSEDRLHQNLSSLLWCHREQTSPHIISLTLVDQRTYSTTDYCPYCNGGADDKLHHRLSTL